MKVGLCKHFICLPQFIIASCLYWTHRAFITWMPFYNASFFRGIIADFLAPIVCIPIFATSQKFFGLRKGNKIYFIEIILCIALITIDLQIKNQFYLIPMMAITIRSSIRVKLLFRWIDER